MSRLFYPQRPNGEPLAEIAVDDPGHGVLHFRDLREDVSTQFFCTLRAHQLDETLDSLTTIATSYDPDVFTEVGHLGFWYVADVRSLLPSFQRAVIFAATRTEFAERLLDPVEDGDVPRPPVCVDCGAGHGYTSDQGRTSAWCEQHGHRAFGTQLTWAAANQAYAVQRATYDQVRAARAQTAGA